MKLIEDYKSVEATTPNIRIPAVIALKHPGFLTDYEILPREEIETHSFYTDFMRPRGYGWVAGSVVEVPTGEMLVFGVERHFKRGPMERPYVDQLDALRPHLARSGLMSARLGIERARAMTETLTILGLPGAVLGSGGRLLACNKTFEALIPEVFRDWRRRVGLAAPEADTLLAEALATHLRGSQPVRSIPVPGEGDRPPMIVHLVPIRRAAHDIFPSATSVLVVTAVVPRDVPQAEVLQGLFDLTPAEARVARRIGQGMTVDQIAAALGLARETVRSRLKIVLAKTGMHRQAQLAGLLSGASIPG
jgi:DNA-binding CsgD family transcriptional regulator